MGALRHHEYTTPDHPDNTIVLIGVSCFVDSKRETRGAGGVGQEVYQLVMAC